MRCAALLALMCLLPSSLSAQAGSLRVGFSTPTAASLGKFGDVPVSLHTGIPEIAIPIFTAKGKTLEVPIALRYHGGGVRVEEKGGWVGIGWALQAGGTITRTVRALPDDGASGFYSTGHSVRKAWPTPSGELMQQILDKEVDPEPDQFFFNFAGRSGEFVMGPTDTLGLVQEVRTIPHQKIRIEPIFGAQIDKWVITTEDGTKYTFAAAEVTIDRGWMEPGTFSDNYGEQMVSTWHLTEIRAPGGDVVRLHYKTYSTTHTLQTHTERFRNVISPEPACVPNEFRIFSRMETIAQRLDSITSAQHDIVFRTSNRTLDALSPDNNPQEPQLDTIIVRTAARTVIRKFVFDYGYFGGNRLRLNSVQAQAPNAALLPPFTFLYDTQTFPSTTSMAQDHWGFFNDRPNSTLIPTTVTSSGLVLPGADRGPDSTKMKVGSLTRVTFPTGGYNHFTWQANDYNGVGTSSAQLYDFAALQSEYMSSTGTEGIQETTFTVGGTGQAFVQVDVTLEPDGCGPESSCILCGESPCPWAEISGVSTWRNTGTDTLVLSPGTYTLRTYSETAEGSASIRVEWRNRIPVNKKLAGGLRIARIETGDGLGNVQVRSFAYTLSSDSTKSSGRINAEPAYEYPFASGTCAYTSESSQSKMPLGAGATVSYSEVTVLHGAGGSFGKTRETFRSIEDAPDPPVEDERWPFARTTSYQWKRGQVIQAAERSSGGQIQRLVKSTYAFQEEDTTTARKFKGLSVHSVAASLGEVQYTVNIWNAFEVISAQTYLSSDSTFTYDEAGTSSLATARTFAYENPKHLQVTRLTETNSDGTTRVTRMLYPADYADGSGNAEAIALTAMKKDSVHIHSPVIERWVSDYAGGTWRVVQAELKTYKTFNAGQYLPHTRFVLKSASPVIDFDSSHVDGAFTKDSRYMWVETGAAYDAAGRITSHNDRWGYTTNYGYGGNVNAAFLSRSRRCASSAACSTGTGGLIEAVGHDSLGNVTSMRDSLTTRRFTYDSFGRLLQIKNHASTPLQGYGYTYSRTGPSWNFNPSIPNVVVDTTYLQHPTLGVVRWTYLDGLGRPIQTVVQDGATYIVTAQQYDAMGREWRKWKPYPRATAAYDTAFATNATAYYDTLHGEPTKPYSEMQYTADVLNRIRRLNHEFLVSHGPDSVKYTYLVDSAQQQTITETTDEVGMKTRSYQDAWGNEVKTILGYDGPAASTTILAYNVLGQRTQVTDPRGLITSFTYNTQGYQRTRTSPDAGTTGRLYDVMNNLRYSQDANQAAAGTGKVYFTNYDFAYRPLTSGLGTATFSGLDPNAATPPALETNNANWLTVRAYDAKPSTAAFPWSRFSKIDSLTLANVYGRLAATANKSNGAWQVQLFSYDADGRVATRHTFTEANGGAQVLTAINDSITYTRDLRDSVTVRRLAVGSSTWYQWYDYDNRGLLWKAFASTSATKPGTPDVTYTYRPSGAVLTREFQGGPAVTLRYTIREQLEQIGNVASGSEPFAARYFYRPDATVDTAEFRSEGAPTGNPKRYRYVHTYDARKRLYGARFYPYNSGWGVTTAYALDGITYDLSSNITFLARNRSDATTVDYLGYTPVSGSNRLSSLTEQIVGSPEAWDAEAGSFTYDANGNMLTAPAPYSITAATYDHMNLPIKFRRGSDSTAYRYNAEGQRIAKRVNTGNIQVYILDGRTTLAFYILNNATGAIVSSHHNILAADRVVGRQVSGVKRFYHTDLLGSTRAVVENGTVVESYDYDPWGVLLEGRVVAGPTKEGFTGKERDAETGLDYFGFRYYMSAIGRWTTVDPPADSFPSWSPYNYVENNPASYTDPVGLSPCDPPTTSCPKPEGNPQSASLLPRVLAVNGSATVATPYGGVNFEIGAAWDWTNGDATVFLRAGPSFGLAASLGGEATANMVDMDEFVGKPGIYNQAAEVEFGGAVGGNVVLRSPGEPHSIVGGGVNVGLGGGGAYNLSGNTVVLKRGNMARGLENYGKRWVQSVRDLFEGNRNRIE